MEKSAKSHSLLILLIGMLLLIPLILAAGTLSNTGGVEVKLNKTDNVDPANASQNLTYVVLVNITSLNQSTTNISNLTLTETYPAQVIFLTAQPTPLAGTNNTFILGNFSTNNSIEVNITVLVLNITNGTVINNTANISFQNGSSVFINVTVTENTTILNPPLINTSNLSVNKTDTADPVNASGNLTYTINVTSNGNATAFNTTVNDTYPSEVIFLTAQPTPLTGTNNTFILGNLTNGTTILINITVLVRNITNGTVINNTANVTFQNETSNTLSILSTQNTTVLNPPLVNTSNLSVNKTDTADPVNASGNLTYTINVTSNGNATAFNTTVNDTYPAEIIFLTAQPTPLTGTNNTFILGNLTNGTSIIINITVLVRNITNGTVINNTVNVTFQNETNQTLSIIATQNTTVLNPPFFNTSNISINKTDSPDPVNASTNLTYTINVTSTGNTTAFNTTVNDTYPSQVIFLTAQPTPLAGTNNTFILGNLTNGTTILINITVFVRNITNGTVINNTANVTFQNETSHVLSRVVTENTTVLNPPFYNTSNISITKTDAPDPVSVGSRLNYTITVNITGNGTSFNITVNDTYPAGLIFDSAQPTPLTGTNNTFILGNLTNGTRIVINITLNVSTALTDGIVLNNSVNVTFQNETSNTLSRTATASTTISNPPATVSGGSGGGGGGGGGVARGQTYSMSANSQTFTLRRNDKVTFMVNNAQHTVTLSSVVPFHVTLQVASQPQQVSLTKGDTKEVDVDADGRPDVRLTVVGITSFDAQVLIETLSTPCVESWTCGDWSACAGGTQARECNDLKACGTAKLKPKTSQACEAVTPAPSPLPAEEPSEPEIQPEAVSAPPREPLPSRKIAGITMTTVFYGLAILALIGLGAYWYISSRWN